jgi:hypothetical protein
MQGVSKILGITSDMSFSYVDNKIACTRSEKNIDFGLKLSKIAAQ